MTAPEFLFGPVPHQEAADFIKNKPVVSRQVFDGLLPDLKARAFTITGLEGHANVIQSVRDRIAELPTGSRWDDVKKDIVNDISPFMVDPDADPDEKAGQEEAAERRAELLLRTHGFQAYQAASYKVMDRQRDVLPYWQYMSMEDDRVRPEHAALDLICLPQSDPFWQTHFPPWDWGCRCMVVPISQADRDDIAKEDEDRPPDQKLALEGPLVTQLNHGRLVRDGRTYDVRPPTDKEGGSGFSWNPSTLQLPLDQLEKRYDPPVWQQFQAWAKKTPATSLKELVARISHGPALSSSEAAAVIKEMSRPRTVSMADKLAALTGDPGVANGAEFCTRAMQHAEDFIKLLPESVTSSLPPITIKVVFALGPHELGQYDPGSRVLKLSASALGKGEAQMRATVFHELMHWVHFHGPDAYKGLILGLFASRTVGEAIQHLVGYGPNVKGKPDDFWDTYMGRVYFDQGIHCPTMDGCEIPTRTIELLTNPHAFARHWNTPSDRQVMEEILSILFTHP